MLFNSLQFFLFFVIVYSIYLFLPHRWQNRLLIAASILFYAAWNWKFLSVMMVSITTDYFCAKSIDVSHDNKTRRFYLLLSIGVNLIILCLFKYFNFFLSNFELLLNCLHLNSLNYIPFKIILPLGISFYTFEAISYTVDVYRRQTKPAQKYSDYLLFVIYFPHLIAGPIMRAWNFLPQIIKPRELSWDLFYQGCFLFFWGLFEKMYVADNLGRIVNPVFALNGHFEGNSVLLALYGFAFQIFCDFDGYSNMARGLGLCMGFDITINFNLPYFSTNPKEFWQRWHISLSTWLRDYLYIPLGGNRQGELKMYAALFITMFLGGLWHGAAWTFVLWGSYHAVLLIIHRIFSRGSGDKKPGNNRGSLKYILKMIVFFHLMVLGWLLFRAESIHQIGEMLYALFTNFKFDGQLIKSWIKAGAFILPLVSVQIWQYRSNDLMVMYKQQWLLKTFLYAVMTYLLIGWGVMNAQEFIYFQF